VILSHLTNLNWSMDSAGTTMCKHERRLAIDPFLKQATNLKYISADVGNDR
jgi:hypothetical protein